MKGSTTSVEDQYRQTVRDSIRAGAAFDRAYLLMNVLAAAIASYGLFANSPAVVIGAMLVAFLLGPILGVSLALVDGDVKFLSKSLLTLLAGVIAVMVTALVIGTIHKDVPITNEIMARTAPNLFDLMIGLAGGAAGAYATVSPRLSFAFVGVAIATALVPPLASATILFGRGDVDSGLGALLLAFANMVAIQFAASSVLWLAGFRRVTQTTGLSLGTFLRRNAASLGILLMLAVVLTASLHRVVARQLYETKTRSALERRIDASAGSHLVEVRFQTVRGSTIVRAVLRGPSPPVAAQVAAMEAQLPSPPDDTNVKLRVRFVQTTIIDRSGPMYKDVGFGSE